MVSTYSLKGKDEAGATFPGRERAQGRSTALDAIVGKIPRLNPRQPAADLRRRAVANADAGTRTNWLRDAVAGCVAWTAYQWRAGQAAAHLDWLFEERLAERTRIAQDLHDTLLQGWMSASMQLHVANHHLPADSPAKPILDRVLDLMNHVAEDGRKAVRGLRSSGEGFDLEKAFARVPQELGIQAAIEFRVIVAGRARPLHPGICDEVYRVGREALSNAFHHAQASTVEAELEYADKRLRLVVRDDGRGIDPRVLVEGKVGHWGLAGMHERAERMGAEFKVWSREGGGTEVELSVPGYVAYRPRPSVQGPRWLANRGQGHDEQGLQKGGE